MVDQELLAAVMCTSVKHIHQNNYLLLKFTHKIQVCVKHVTVRLNASNTLTFNYNTEKSLNMDVAVLLLPLTTQQALCNCHSIKMYNL